MSYYDKDFELDYGRMPFEYVREILLALVHLGYEEIYATSDGANKDDQWWSIRAKKRAD